MSDGPDTVLAYLHDDEVASSFLHSVLDLVIWDMSHDQHLATYEQMRCGTLGIVDRRNQVAADFLGLDFEWLFAVDSDMGFKPDTLDRLIEAADPVERPIVGGLCFTWKEIELDGLGGFRCVPLPTILDLTDTGDSFTRRNEYTADTLTSCNATGMACILIHRTVLEKIQAEHGDNWFTRIEFDDGTKLGEDTSFCVRAGELGFPVHVHTGVKTNHLKPHWVSELDYVEHYPNNVTES